MRCRFVAYGVGFIAVPLAVFLAVAEDVAEHAVFSWDKGLLHFAALHRSGALTVLFEFATRLGTTAVMSALTGSLLLYLLARRRWRDALFAGVAVGGAALLNAAVKEMFRRPRPDLFHPLAHASGFAFPSGHTMSSAALAAVVVALTWPTRWRWPALAASVLFTVVVGFSRVYLGVHYPSDVVGGWALSLAFVSATYLAAYRRGRAVGMGPAPVKLRYRLTTPVAARSTSRLAFRLMALAFAVRDWMSPREAILDEVGIAPGFRVLDYGCGPGSYIVAAARRAGASGRVYAVDSNPLALEETRRRAAANGLSNVATIRTDCATGLPNESIDRVLLYDILHDLDRPADVLAELQRVLKRDGVLSVSDHHLSEAEILDRVTRAGSFKLSSKGAKTYSFTKVGE